MVTENGLAKDPELAQKIDKAVFPGVQGGPHMENVAALAVALAEAEKPEFKSYAAQVVKNAVVLADELKKLGFKLMSGGTWNHMVWIDLSDEIIDGWTLAWGLEYAGIIANRQTVPTEKRSAYYPSGLRIGTPAVTTRGMKEAEMKQIAVWISLAKDIIEKSVKNKYQNIGSKNKEEDQMARKAFKLEMKNNKELLKIGLEVKELCRKFPIPV